MKQAYLDNSATTAVCKQAADKAYEMMTGCYGNPSSLHTVGFAAEQELTAARRAVAKLLGCPPDTLIFTSGGTEANNLAILGGWAARKRRGGHAVTPPSPPLSTRWKRKARRSTGWFPMNRDA